TVVLVQLPNPVNKDGVANVIKTSSTDVKLHDENEKCDFHSLITPTGNGIDVAVLKESIRSISERCANAA
nr:hypothetical protein [Tanacetum cinerariifolium]